MNRLHWSASSLFTCGETGFLMMHLKIDFTACTYYIFLRSSYIIAQVVWAKAQQNQAPSEDSDQPGHQPSLIRAFTVHIKKLSVLSYPESVQQRLWIQTEKMPRLIGGFAGLTSYFVGFVMRWLILYGLLFYHTITYHNIHNDDTFC